MKFLLLIFTLCIIIEIQKGSRFCIVSQLPSPAGHRIIVFLAPVRVTGADRMLVGFNAVAVEARQSAPYNISVMSVGNVKALTTRRFVEYRKHSIS